MSSSVRCIGDIGGYPEHDATLVIYRDKEDETRIRYRFYFNKDVEVTQEEQRGLIEDVKGIAAQLFSQDLTLRAIRFRGRAFEDIFGSIGVSSKSWEKGVLRAQHKIGKKTEIRQVKNIYFLMIGLLDVFSRSRNAGEMRDKKGDLCKRFRKDGIQTMAIDIESNLLSTFPSRGKDYLLQRPVEAKEGESGLCSVLGKRERRREEKPTAPSGKRERLAEPAAPVYFSVPEEEKAETPEAEAAAALLQLSTSNPRSTSFHTRGAYS